MKTAFYKLQNGELSTASKSDGAEWKQYTVGQEPQELKEILDAQLAEETTRNKNNAIYAQLENIDIKSIRAMRENNQERLTAYQEESIALRSQLVSKNETIN